MAKQYLMEYRMNGEEVVFERPKRPEKRLWLLYRNPATRELHPAPGQPGCPVTPEAMKIAVEELRKDFPDLTWEG